MKNFMVLIAGVTLTALIGLVDVSQAAGVNKDQKPGDKVTAENFNSSRSNVSSATDPGDDKGTKPMAKNYSSSRSNNVKGESNPGDKEGVKDQRKKKGDGG